MQKNAYVTGADRGLGLALVSELLERGYRVFAGRYLSEENSLHRLKHRYDRQLIVLPLDVTDKESVQQAAAAISAETDTLQLLINNAGKAVERSETILDPLYEDDMLTIYDTNALGPLRVTKSVLDLLLRADSKMLVNISSVAGSVGLVTRRHQYGYTMSKAALNMQSKLIYNHLRERGLRVLVVHPGWMHTEIFGDLDRMKDAPLQPGDSARYVLQLIEQGPSDEDGIYFDYKGEPLPW